jgi:hypothetical protein
MSESNSPLVSAVLFSPGGDIDLRLSVSYFLRQTHGEKELIVVHSTDEVGDSRGLPADPRIKLVAMPAGATAASRLLKALETCRGQFLAWWDPLDWIGPERLAEQVRVLSGNERGICIAEKVLAYHPIQARAWNCVEDPPGLLARRTWCCRRATVSDDQNVLTLLADRPNAYFSRVPPARAPAPWYVWILGASGRAEVDYRQIRREPSGAGEVTRLMWLDREHYVAQRVRHRARRLPKSITERRERSGPGTMTTQERSRPRNYRSAPTTPRRRVSCLMPTFNRRSYVAHAVQCFLEQDFPDRELVIVDDGTDRIEDLVPRDERVVYMGLNSRRSIGAKRNLAMELASGDYLMCWDDDDWSGPGRISYQVAPLLAGQYDATALRTGFILDQCGDQLWSKRADQAGTLFQSGVNWGTLAWTRTAQNSCVRFPDKSLAEDLAFRNELIRHGARLRCLENPGVYVYVRHGSNTWRFEEEKMLVGDRWERIARPNFLPQSTLDFYRLNRQRASVSCAT